MVLLDLADNSWMPLLIVFVVMGVGALLYWSMNRHLKKIDVPADHGDGADEPTSPPDPTVQP